MQVQNFVYLLTELEEVSVDIIFKYLKITLDWSSTALQSIPILVPSLVSSASLLLVLSSKFLVKQLNKISFSIVYCLLHDN